MSRYTVRPNRAPAGVEDVVVEDGFWSGYQPLAKLGEQLSKSHTGYSPDPDWDVAAVLAERTGGFIVEERAPPAPLPRKGVVE